MTKLKDVTAMAFYHAKGFVPAYNLARKFAGSGGRIAKMSDIILGRIESSPYKEPGLIDTNNITPWDRYYTTLTAEYFGMLAGRKTIIVADGIGPMSTLQGIIEAYRFQFDDKSRNNNGGRISQAEFEKLALGKYGKVTIIDFAEYQKMFGKGHYNVPFGYRKASEALRDPLLMARLGEHALEYIKKHASMARKHHKEDAGLDVSDPYILSVEDPGNPSYWCREVEAGMAFAHLTSIGAICNMHHQSGIQSPSWACELAIHDWWDGVRLVGVRENSNGTISDGPDARLLIHKHWNKLFEASGLQYVHNGLFVLMQMGEGTHFTQVPKKGSCLDTGQPEFLVTKIEEVGEITRFYTESNYPVPFFRYDIREVKAVLPKEANAYMLIGRPGRALDGTDRETCMVQGYRVEIDYTKRLVKAETLANDFDKMMTLLGVE